MGLTHSQYDAIMRVYDRRRISNHHIEEEHRRIAYKAIPELQELDRAVAHCAADRVRSLLTPMEMHAAGGAAVPFRDLLKKLAGGEDPAQKRRRLLAEHSFPEDAKGKDSMFQLLNGMLSCGLKNDLLMEVFYEQISRTQAL